METIYCHQLFHCEIAIHKICIFIASVFIKYYEINKVRSYSTQPELKITLNAGVMCCRIQLKA